MCALKTDIIGNILQGSVKKSFEYYVYVVIRDHFIAANYASIKKNPKLISISTKCQKNFDGLLFVPLGRPSQRNLNQ